MKIIIIFIAFISNIATAAQACEVHENTSENLGIEVEKLSDKTIKVHYLHRGLMPVGIHMLPDPNIILRYPQNTLTHSPKNRLGPIILDKDHTHQSFVFQLEKKIQKLDNVYYNNEKTRHLGFTSDLIKPLSPKIQLCSWIRSK